MTTSITAALLAAQDAQQSLTVLRNALASSTTDEWLSLIVSGRIDAHRCLLDDRGQWLNVLQSFAVLHGGASQLTEPQIHALVQLRSMSIPWISLTSVGSPIGVALTPLQLALQCPRPAGQLHAPLVRALIACGAQLPTQTQAWPTTPTTADLRLAIDWAMSSAGTDTAWGLFFNVLRAVADQEVAHRSKALADNLAIHAPVQADFSQQTPLLPVVDGSVIQSGSMLKRTPFKRFLKRIGLMDADPAAQTNLRKPDRNPRVDKAAAQLQHWRSLLRVLQPETSRSVARVHDWVL